MTISKPREKKLVIIGSGLAGLAAAGFASARGFTVTVVSATSGELVFASGALDLMGTNVVEGGEPLIDPWKGISDLTAHCPEHPFSLVGVEKIRAAFDEFVKMLADANLPYQGWNDKNSVLLTPAGTMKATYRLPITMWTGNLGYHRQQDVLIVDFEGMKEFSAIHIAETLKKWWPNSRHARVSLPTVRVGADQQNSVMAELFESAELREAIAGRIKSHLRGESLVGVPAVLGVRNSREVTADLEMRTGVSIFEIPTFPPSVPGLRLKDTLEEMLTDRGVRFIRRRKVQSARTSGMSCTGIVVGDVGCQQIVRGDAYILATGRFIGGGLIASRQGIREPVFDLPVAQPDDRSGWHRPRFLSRRGHPINQSGVVVDQTFRPLSPGRNLVYENLFVVGTILAGQDWMRTKSGSGIALASAYGAVESFAALMDGDIS